MSSINHPKNSGQKTVLFHSFLAPKSPLNHYMLWSNPIISPLNHNTSSELYSQRGTRSSDWCLTCIFAFFLS